MFIKYDSIKDWEILKEYILTESLRTGTIVSWDEVSTVEYEKYLVFKKSLYSIYVSKKNKNFMILIEDNLKKLFMESFVKKSISNENEFNKLLKNIAYLFAINRI